MIKKGDFWPKKGVKNGLFLPFLAVFSKKMGFLSKNDEKPFTRPWASGEGTKNGHFLAKLVIFSKNSDFLTIFEF